jgi:hypothetical protein
LATASTAIQDELVFYVHGEMDGPRMLENVLVWAVTRRGGVRELGKTDIFGSISLNKQELLDVIVLGFSHDGFFDGAWRVDREKLHRFDELHIGLAHFTVF